jgi:hypothetical protein
MPPCVQAMLAWLGFAAQFAATGKGESHTSRFYSCSALSARTTSCGPLGTGNRRAECAAACVYLAGPMANLADHLADPTHVNFTTNGVSIPIA